MDDVAVVTILHRRQDLPELPPGFKLTETAMLCQVVCSQREREITKMVESICTYILTKYVKVILHTDLYSMILWTFQTRYKQYSVMKNPWFF